MDFLNILKCNKFILDLICLPRCLLEKRVLFECIVFFKNIFVLILLLLFILYLIFLFILLLNEPLFFLIINFLITLINISINLNRCVEKLFIYVFLIKTIIIKKDTIVHNTSIILLLRVEIITILIIISTVNIDNIISIIIRWVLRSSSSSSSLSKLYNLSLTKVLE